MPTIFEAYRIAHARRARSRVRRDPGQRADLSGRSGGAAAAAADRRDVRSDAGRDRARGRPARARQETGDLRRLGRSRRAAGGRGDRGVAPGAGGDHAAGPLGVLRQAIRCTRASGSAWRRRPRRATPSPVATRCSRSARASPRSRPAVTASRCRTSLVHVDINPEVFGANYPAAVALEGDAAAVLGAVARGTARADRDADAPMRRCRIASAKTRRPTSRSGCATTRAGGSARRASSGRCERSCLTTPSPRSTTATTPT